MEKLAGILLKPDVFERNLEELIINDIRRAGFSIEEKFPVVIGKIELKILYPTLVVNKQIQRNLIDYFSRGRNEFLLVSHEEINANPIDILKIWKGSKITRTGIRGKYLEIDPESIDKKKDKAKYYEFMRENLVHTFDDYSSFLRFFNKVRNESSGCI